MEHLLGRKPLKPYEVTENVRLLLMVEGCHDIEFLRRISRTLSNAYPHMPNLAEMEQRGELVFLPVGGQVRAWTHRLAALQKPEFFLLDHEIPPETEFRREAAKIINGRPCCRAFVMKKRSLENYLHPQAIKETANIEVAIDDFDPVGTVVAKALYEVNCHDKPWELLSRRAHSRMINRAKRWLNTVVADCMTSELIQERDPKGEIASWLLALDQLAHSA